jgi:acyl-CoA thioesterase-1
MRQARWLSGLLLVLAGCSHSSGFAGGTGTVMLVMGDSLSAGYGLATPQQTGWVALLEQDLRKQTFLRSSQLVVNASVSGETSEGGLARLPALLSENKPGLVVIELGGNDALRHQSMGTLETNLGQMITQSRAAGARVAILAVRLPMLFGLGGGGKLEDVYAKVGKDMNVPIISYPLDDLFGEPGMMQADRLHPTQEAQPLIVKEVEDPIKDLLASK